MENAKSSAECSPQAEDEDKTTPPEVVMPVAAPSPSRSPAAAPPILLSTPPREENPAPLFMARSSQQAITHARVGLFGRPACRFEGVAVGNVCEGEQSVRSIRSISR